jgi:hypothetical protein
MEEKPHQIEELLKEFIKNYSFRQGGRSSLISQPQQPLVRAAV